MQFKHITKWSLFALFSIFYIKGLAQTITPNPTDFQNRIDRPFDDENSLSSQELRNSFYKRVQEGSDFRESFEAARFIENKGQWNFD